MTPKPSDAILDTERKCYDNGNVSIGVSVCFNVDTDSDADVDVCTGTVLGNGFCVGGNNNFTCNVDHIKR